METEKGRPHQSSSQGGIVLKGLSSGWIEHINPEFIIVTKHQTPQQLIFTPQSWLNKKISKPTVELESFPSNMEYIPWTF